MIADLIQLCIATEEIQHRDFYVARYFSGIVKVTKQVNSAYFGPKVSFSKRAKNRMTVVAAIGKFEESTV